MYQVSAITAIPDGICFTFTTPAFFCAVLASKLLTFAPKTVGCKTAAYFKPSTLTSNPKSAFPVTLAQASFGCLECGFPTIVQSFNSFILGSVGTFIEANKGTKSPKVSSSFVLLFITFEFFVSTS